MKARLVTLLLLGATNTTAALIPLDEVTATGDFCSTCSFDASPELSIDGNFTTKWTGTDDLDIGDVNILAYRFDHLFTLISIDLFMLNPLEVWVLGELDVQVSSDTTDGFDGTWTTLASRPGDTPDNVVTVDFAPVASEWLRLRMEYQGRGASGITPAFGLHEIRFHRVAAPSTLLLIGSGLLGLAARRQNTSS